jgi:hypothetical protein
MKRTDPATDLAERAIRQWQMSGSKTERHDLAKQTEVIPAEVRAEGGISTFTVGSVAGFLGAITCLICNIAGALVLGVEPLRLLRIYATILEGRRALDISRAGFFIAAFTLHIVTGIFFGTIFALGARKFCAGLQRYILAGAGYGIAIWLVNFYGILSWLQPLLHGSAFILTEIPIAVAVLTHVNYGLTVALVTYVLQRDFMYPSQTNAQTKE